MTQDIEPPIPAPAPPDPEALILKAVHVYEKVKFGLLIFVAGVVIAIGMLLLQGQEAQRHTLLILNCAVSHEVQDAGAKGGSDPQLRTKLSREAYDRCVHRGRPLPEATR